MARKVGINLAAKYVTSMRGIDATELFSSFFDRVLILETLQLDLVNTPIIIFFPLICAEICMHHFAEHENKQTRCCRAVRFKANRMCRQLSHQPT